MTIFTKEEFNWKYQLDKKLDIPNVVNILNSLTEEQKAAVRTYGSSCNADGYQEAQNEFSPYRE